MNKTVLEKFISKYNLSGTVDAVTLKVTNGKLTTEFISDDKNVIGSVSCEVSDMPDGTYPVYETSQLRSLIGVLDEDITVKVNTVNGKNTSITFSDKGGIKTNFVLSSEDNIPRVPALKKLPDFEISSKIDGVFMKRFVKAKSALPDVETFAVVSGKNGTEIVLGHSSRNTNRVSIPLTGKFDEIRTVNFHARYLKDIFTANAEATSCQFDVSGSGIARVKFTLDGADATYYLPEIKVDD